MIYFVGAGCGDPELLTIKGANLLKKADAVLYTGSLVPKEILKWCNSNAIIQSSQNMNYDEIFDFLLKYSDKLCVRLHTGDPSLYSTIAKQIDFLKQKQIPYQVIPGVSAAFGAAASLGIEYTIPGVSQTLILTRIEGKTPNPQKLEELLQLRHSSFVFYLSISLIELLKTTALQLGYSPNTPCWVIYKATWSNEEQIYKGTIDNIIQKVQHIKGVALILFGDFLNQQEATLSHLYNQQY